jgi:tetratricopeptide (TPR) repeat protein
MKGPVSRWALAFGATSGLAALMLVASLKGPAAAEAVARRDPSKVTDVELELILNKVREGDLRAVKGEIEPARKAWLEARRQGEGLWPIHEGLGDSYARAKLHEEALREYAVAESLVPEKLAALRASIAAKRAEVHAAAGKPLEAIRVHLESGAPPAARILALAEKSDPAAAAKLVAERAEIHDPRLFALLASLSERMGRKAEAADALGKYCIAVSPWDETLNRKAVESLRAERRYDPAIEVCRAWAKSVPTALVAYQLMGDLHLEAGREREAVVAYTSIVDVRAGDAAAHRMLAEIFRKLKRDDDAIAQYELARKARPEDQSNYSVLVELYAAKGETAKWEAVALEASKRFGTTGELRTRLAAVYQERLAKLKAEGKAEEVRELRRRLGELNMPELGLFDLKVIMTWDARSDVDMDVIEPGGEKVNHGHGHSKSGGHYYVDNTTAYGPETYTLPRAAPGVYRIGAHLHGDVKSTVKFVVILWEDTPREERREETFVLEKSGQERFIRDLEVLTK